MNRLRITFALFALFSLNAEALVEGSRAQVNLLKKHSSGIPHLPPYYVVADIDCYYEDGFLYIEFSQPEGYASISITNNVTGQGWISGFSTALPSSVAVSFPSYNMSLEIETDAGNIYFADFSCF